MSKVQLTETIFRDAHQSLIATRMRTRDMLPICEKLDDVGFFSLEVWGGATFDTCIRYLNEDPWERLVQLKEHLPKTPLQMLLRGQNLVGYRHYADDVVDEFVAKAAQNGVDIFRIFDAVNDIRNLTQAITATKRAGAHAQGALSYTISPVHTLDQFVDMAKELEALECDSLCIKDMAGLMTPHAAYEVISTLKREIDIPVCLHTHCTSGMAPMTYMAACYAGVDILDTAFSPLSGGTSQPPTESIVAALADTRYSTGIDLVSLSEIKDYFEEIREKYLGLIDPISERVDTNVLIYQLPGGMLSNLISQLKEQNAADRYKEVLEELPHVRKDLGYPPLVTPTSQIVGTQAVLNVLTGERYKTVTKETKDYVKGLYGKSPAPIHDEIIAAIIGEDEEPITCRPADLIKPEMDKMRAEANELRIVKKDEDVLTYALYPAIAPAFLRGETVEEKLVPSRKDSDGAPAGAIPTEYKVNVDGEEFHVKLNPVGYSVAEISSADSKSIPKGDVKGGVSSHMQGMVLKVLVKVGDNVSDGDVVAVLEAMKMENDIHSPHTGTVSEIFVDVGDIVTAGNVLVIVE